MAVILMIAHLIQAHCMVLHGHKGIMYLFLMRFQERNLLFQVVLTFLSLEKAGTQQECVSQWNDCDVVHVN